MRYSESGSGGGGGGGGCGQAGCGGGCGGCGVGQEKSHNIYYQNHYQHQQSQYHQAYT